MNVDIEGEGLTIETTKADDRYLSEAVLTIEEYFIHLIATVEVFLLKEYAQSKLNDID